MSTHLITVFINICSFIRKSAVAEEKSTSTKLCGDLFEGVPHGKGVLKFAVHEQCHDVNSSCNCGEQSSLIGRCPSTMAAVTLEGITS